MNTLKQEFRKLNYDRVGKNISNIKKILVFVFLIFFTNSLFSQTFFVEKNPDGFEQPILDRLIELNRKVSLSQQTSDYTIQCTVTNSGMGRAKGFITIYDSRSGLLLLKSEKAHGQTSAFNGYASPKMNVMKKIAKKDLEDLLTQVKNKK